MNFLYKYKVTFAVVMTFICANIFAMMLDLPNYGIWTGIRPIEEKMRKLEQFASEGDIDAVVLGPSISDFGFSAELYSKIMSESLRRPFRVFNFSTGAAELSFMPTLYRMVRTVAKPKAIFLSTPVQIKQVEVMTVGYPDHTLKNSPIGSYLNNGILLQLSKVVWSLPILEKSSALRDLLIYGRFKNLIGQGMDTFPLTAYGDRLSYSAGIANLQIMNKERGEHAGDVRPLPSDDGIDSKAAQRHFFAIIGIKAMESLRKMALSDGTKIYVMAHASSSVMLQTPMVNTNYRTGRTQFFEVLTEMLGASLINPLDELSIPDFAMMDGSHLNTYGARLYTRAITSMSNIQSATVKQLPDEPIDAASLAPIRSKDVTFNTWSAVVMRDKSIRHKALKCRFVNNFAVPTLPESDLFFAIRMPNGSDVVVPARKLGSGEYEASLDLEPSPNRQALILRLVYGASREPMSAPLAEYKWTSN